MLPSFASQSILRERAALVDDGHGNQVRDWTSPSVLSITGCSVQPGTTAVDRLNRDGVLIQWTVFCPAGADVLAGDRIQLAGGLRYEIDGEPLRWQFGVVDYVVLYLKRWEG
jgi:hypothetical protein